MTVISYSLHVIMSTDLASVGNKMSNLTIDKYTLPRGIYDKIIHKNKKL